MVPNEDQYFQKEPSYSNERTEVTKLQHAKKILNAPQHKPLVLVSKMTPRDIS